MFPGWEYLITFLPGLPSYFVTSSTSGHVGPRHRKEGSLGDSKKKIGIVIVVAVLAITFMTVAFLTTQTNTDYYTQIDNRWVTDIAPHGAMNYKYTLVAYDESGNAKDVTFETSKVLTDGAYLCLKVAPIRGVVTWAEMQFDELPSSVQEKYKE